jgi:hypothetical protein
MALVAGVEDPMKKAISSLPVGERRCVFSIEAIGGRAIFFA